VRAYTAAVERGDPGEGGRRQGDRDGPGCEIEPGGRQATETPRPSARGSRPSRTPASAATRLSHSGSDA
jgi:hypothetical protein